MPEPQKGESEKDFLKRCIPMLIKEEGYKKNQAIAICYSIYRKKGEGKKSPKPDKKKKLTKEEKCKILMICE